MTRDPGADVARAAGGDVRRAARSGVVLACLGVAALGLASLSGSSRAVPRAQRGWGAASLRAQPTRVRPPAASSAVPDAPVDPCRAEPLTPPTSFPLPLKALLLVGELPSITGSASIGTPTRGALWSGVELAASDDIERAGGYPFGTASVVRSIERAARTVRRCHPGSPRLRVGDLSREHGGWLRPHRSHQSGLDADLGYFYRGPSVWYQRATAQNLDVERTWTLVQTLVDGGNVDTIFIDLGIQRLLKAHLATLGDEGRRGLALFPSPTRREATIRHAWGHATHLHVRFRDAEAEALGEQLDRLRRDAPRR